LLSVKPRFVLSALHYNIWAHAIDQDVNGFVRDKRLVNPRNTLNAPQSKDFWQMSTDSSETIRVNGDNQPVATLFSKTK
jgi:hypothetical protein